jgi:hypothetical protein
VMISPLPRNKRAKNPRQVEGEHEDQDDEGGEPAPKNQSDTVPIDRGSKSGNQEKSGNFANNPFEQIQSK